MRGTLKKLLLVLAVSMAIGLGVCCLRCHEMQPGSHPRRESLPGGSALPSLHDLHHQGWHLQAREGGHRQ